jgi:hypothetical protein
MNQDMSANEIAHNTKKNSIHLDAVSYSILQVAKLEAARQFLSMRSAGLCSPDLESKILINRPHQHPNISY